MSDRRVHTTARAGCAAAADLYARARPSYPAAAVDWLVEQLGLKRVDEIVVPYATETYALRRQR